MDYQVQAGDVFFTKSESTLAELIRWAEKDPGEEKSWANHVGVVVKDGVLIPGDDADNLAMVVEALQRVKHHTFWGHYKDKQVVVEVFRRANLTPLELGRVCEYAKKQTGNKYGWWKLLFHGLDRWLFDGKKTLSRLLLIDKRPICSYLVAKAYNLIRIDFGGRPQAMDPDEMHDWVRTTPTWEYLFRAELNQED